MKHILHLIKTTLWGGLFFLVPIGLVVIILEKVYSLLQKLLYPIVSRLPYTDVAGRLALQKLGAVVFLLLVCFVAGLLARARAGKRFTNWLEHTLLGAVPGYMFLKNMAKTIAGLEEQELETVLARVDDGWQLSFLIEQVGEDMFTVFVPGAPYPGSGAVYHIEKEKVIRTNITQKQALRCIRQLGFGSAEILKPTLTSPATCKPEPAGIRE